MKILEKMKPVTVWQEEDIQSFTFPRNEKAVASPIIALSGVDAGYESGKPVLRNLNLRIYYDDRIALLGANGNGKSTFAKLLAGRLTPQAGSMTLSPNL